MPELKEASRRFRDRAAALGLAAQITEHAQSSRTAEEAAAACGCAVGQIVKSLVFKGAKSGKPYLLLVAGDNRVDQKGVAQRIGEPLDRPDADFVRALTGFAIGGIPPLGHDTPIATYMDEDLLEHEQVWAAAGTPNSVFPVAPRALAAAAKATIIPVK